MLTGEDLRVCVRKPHLYRTCSIAVVVGTWLTLFNQGEFLLSGAVGGALATKVVLNYLTPFVVANLGLLSRQND